MKKYAEYCREYQEYKILFFITERKPFRKPKRRVARIKIRKNGTTLKYIELPLQDNLKLNKETENLIIKYAIDFINTNLKMKEESE